MATSVNTRPTLEDPAARLAYQQSLDCVHCGLCTQHCPTYRVTGDESRNPRGRIYLMRAKLEGRLDDAPDYVDALDSCLVCRACESVCPSGVRFGELMSHARAGSRRPGLLRRLMLTRIIPNRRNLNRLAALIRFWQRSGLRILRHVLPARLRAMEAISPTVPAAAVRRPLPRSLSAFGTPKGRVALLEGCVMSILFQDVNRDTARILQHAGFDVVVPEGQTCCGALHEHDGDLVTARRLASQNISTFTAASVVALVSNSAGCGAAIQGYAHLIPGDDATKLSGKLVDLSRFLVDRLDSIAWTARTETVTYDAPCHLYHAQGETQAPIEILRRLPGVRFVPLELSDLCCGAAGIYNVDHPEMSAAILAPKLDALARTGASVLVTGNPGCQMQWARGIAERGLPMRVEHLATFLAARLPSVG